ncbi:MAG: methyltransferase [Anaerolineae bacterium]|nr:methyltransferase [Anaerolineae bacterium]
MKTLAKDQHKTNDRIMAWLEGKPYREYPEQRFPRVPDLKPGFVLQTYTPPQADMWEQFFTPLPAAQQELAHLLEGETTPGGSRELEVLDLCAGIGHLIYALNGGKPFSFMTAYEIEPLAYRIGSKLFPWVSWYNRNVFDTVDYLTNGFDLVVCNPPFGGGAHLKPDPASGKLWHATKTDHLFLELAARSLREGGRAIFFALHNFMELPPSLEAYLDEIGVAYTGRNGPLPGDFLQTGVKIYAYYFERR